MSTRNKLIIIIIIIKIWLNFWKICLKGILITGYFQKKGRNILREERGEFFRTWYILKVMDNLDGYDSSHDFLLSGEEHSNAIANENSKGFLPKMRSNPKRTLDLVTFTEESLMENFIFFAVSGAQLEMFQGSRAFVEFGHFHKSFVKNTKKGPARKNCVVFSPRYL